ncbi:E3 ubiquitin-protein ligase rnf8-A-like isoform X2 [Stegodyphus dumicola]|nr:E3 ubiquitin-protein ligase rnf8-A-like isoform X2 [Stegodyphus dumicola]
MRNSTLSGNENSSVKLGYTDDEPKKCEIIVSKSLQCSERKNAIPEMPECSSNRINLNFNDNNQDCKINDDPNENGEGSLSDSCSSDSSMASLESLQTRIRRKIASKQKSKQLGDGEGPSSSVPRKRKKKNDKDLEPGNLISLNVNIPATSGTEKPLQDGQKDENESVEEHKNHTRAKAKILTDSERQGLESEDSQSLLTESCITFDFDSHPFSQEIPQQHEIPETKAVISASDGMHSENQKWNLEAYEKMIVFLQSKLNECEKNNLALEKSLKEANVTFITEEVKQNLNQEFRKKLEDLHCTICTELCIKTVVLNCSHSFCKYCITEWKKKKKQCPICRERVTTETDVLALDHFIEKVTDLLSKEELERRKELIESREQAKVQTTPMTTRARRRGRGRQQSRQLEQRMQNSIEFMMEVDGIIAMATEDGVIAVGSEDGVITMATSQESDSDSSVEGLSYYPGYGRCFNCGRRGHWSNGCPLR